MPSRLGRGWRALQVEPRLLLEAPALLLIVLATAIRSVSLDDLALYDETGYLSGGLGIREGHAPVFTGGATYSDLYYLLSHLTTDPVGLYFAGRATAAVLLVLGVWLAARLLSSAVLAWVAAAAVAATHIPYVWPGVSAPAAAMILVAVALALRYPGAASLGMGAGLVWIAAGSRPELAWVAIVWSVLALIAVVGSLRNVRRSSWGSVAAVGLGALAVPLLLIAVHGNPFGSSGREWVAFQQHFSLRHAEAGLDPWVNSSVIVQKSFPGANSITDAATTNPGAFATHLGANLLDLPQSLFLGAMGIGASDLLVLIGTGMIITIVVSLVVSLLIDVSGMRRRIEEQWRLAVEKRRRLVWVGLAAVLISILASVTLVYPREHYLLVPAAGLVVLIVALQHRIGSQRFTTLLPVTAAILLFALFSLQVARLTIARMAYPAPLAATVTRMIDSGHDWRLLGGGQLLPVYIPRLTEVTDADPLPGETFPQFIDRLDITALLTGSTETVSWSGMPGFEAFMADPSQYGFQAPFAGSQLWFRSP